MRVLVRMKVANLTIKLLVLLESFRSWEWLLLDVDLFLAMLLSP